MEDKHETVLKKKKRFSNLNLKIVVPFSISLMLIFIIGFSSATYAWIFKTFFSNIAGIDIALVDSQGLIMSINGEVTDTIDINDYLGGIINTFSLKEASSYNGRDLYFRDSGSYYWDEFGIYNDVAVARDQTGIIQFRQANTEDRNINFLYFSFILEASGENRYLVFNSDECYIKDAQDNEEYPLRVSLTFIQGETVTTKIMGNRPEYLGNYYTDAVGSIDSTTKVGYTTDQNVATFADYNGYTGLVFDPAKTLYYLQTNLLVEVVVRIWLEGGDPLCVDAIAASLLSIGLFFDNIPLSEV